MQTRRPARGQSCGQVARRRLRLHEDRAGRRISITTRLGSAQYFNIGDVIELEQLTRRGIHVDAVLIDRHRAGRVCVEVVQPHTANEKDGITGSKSLIDLEIGRDIRKVRDIANALLNTDLVDEDTSWRNTTKPFCIFSCYSFYLYIFPLSNPK